MQGRNCFFEKHMLYHKSFVVFIKKNFITWTNQEIDGSLTVESNKVLNNQQLATTAMASF